MWGEYEPVIVSEPACRRARYIFALCDGSGKDGRTDKHKTNVYRLYERISEASPEGSTVVDGVEYEVVSRYFPGIGCDSTAAPGLLSKVCGSGIVKIVAEVYIFLLEYYRPGDNICIFGYSRGAFIARKVASLLSHIGRSVSSKDELLEQWKHRENGVPWAEKRRRNTIPVKYLGVWDTVASLYTLPKLKPVKDLIGISDEEIPVGVENALHAVAFHENRRHFRVTLFENKNSDAEVQEVWFTGAHSDVGGGGHKETQLSDITLNWMIGQVGALSHLKLAKVDYNNVDKLAPLNAFQAYHIPERVVDHKETRIDSQLLTADSRIHQSVQHIEKKQKESPHRGNSKVDSSLATLKKLRAKTGCEPHIVRCPILSPPTPRTLANLMVSFTIVPNTNQIQPPVLVPPKPKGKQLSLGWTLVF